MNPRITMIGGGSYHWTPRLLCDFVNTPSLAGAEIVLNDLDESRAAAMADFGSWLAGEYGVAMTVRSEPDRRAALDGAGYVTTAFSVGGFESMQHDLNIPERYGIRQPIGDSVGPGGIMRALRSIPVLLAIARDIADVCPEAWLLNVTNPLTALCRATTMETPVKTVGLCNELVGLQFVMSLLLDADLRTIDPVVGGVNHFPIVTELRAGGRDGFAELRALLEDGERAARETMWMEPGDVMEYEKVTPGERWTKADVIANNRVRIELFRRFGVMPGSSDHHVAEFFPGFVTPDNAYGSEWKVHIYGLRKHMADSAADVAHFERLRREPDLTKFPSGELVALVLDGLVGGRPRNVPVNLPNRGQVKNLPEGRVVEAIGVVDAAGISPRDEVEVPTVLGEFLRRISDTQERTVEAALTGNRELVFEAMLTDPLAGRLPYEQVVTMTEEMLAATAAWLPQFA